MANTKNYSIRERILDHYLSSGKWYSRAQLEDFCNRALEEQGENPITSRTTIQNDLTTISNKFHVNIDTKKKGRVWFYRYQDPSFSIFSSELKEEDYEKLQQAMETLNRFKGLPQFEWVDELGARFNESFLGGSSKPIVGFESYSYNRGMEYFTPLFEAIKQHLTLSVQYKSFKMNEPRTFVISPYYLKAYNGRWFLIAKERNYDSLTNYALDRIEGLENAGVPYEPTDIDFDEYFEDVIGVSVPQKEPEKIEIWFSTEQLKYVETKPIHGSQKIIHRDETGGIIQLELIPNYELEQLILSFGEKAQVLSPASLQQKIKERMKTALEKYQSDQFA